jgi:hypothetical protein
MKKIISIVGILLVLSGCATAAEFWHFGAGLRLTGVMPGKDYANALGGGVLLTFGNPDSRFTTQLDLDSWNVTYQKSDSLIRIVDPNDTANVTVRERNFSYSGMGAGVYEKYRAFDFSQKISTYVIGGFGAYFLDRKREDQTNFVVSMKSFGLHSLLHWSAGLGFEGQITSHISSFIEGRFVGLISGNASDKNLLKGYLGVRYVF